MKSILSLALLISSASAFFTQQPSGVAPPSTKAVQTDERRRSSVPSIVGLDASKNRRKVESRTRWSDARGYGTSGVDDVIAPSESETAVGAKTGPRLIIAGAPASGKGTQCELIKAKYGVVHLSTGDMLRAAVSAGTDVGKQAKDYMDSGRLVPDDVIIGVVSFCASIFRCMCIVFVVGGGWGEYVWGRGGRNLFAPLPHCLTCILSRVRGKRPYLSFLMSNDAAVFKLHLLSPPPLSPRSPAHALNFQVKERLDSPDCTESGWLLDGFPRTLAQAEALAEAGISADCFIFLNVPDDVLVERVVGRRTDPVTGKIYHMTFSPPDDEEILKRLEQRSDDTEEKVKVRLGQFHANVEAVRGSYTDIAVEVDGTQMPEEVSTMIMKTIDAVLT